MSIDATLFYAFFTGVPPLFRDAVHLATIGAQNTPLQVRIFCTLAISAALTFTIKAHLGPPPADLYAFAMAILHELIAGALIGIFLTLVLEAAQMAGAFIDLQMGLSMSQTLNPITGVPVSVMSQFKYMLGLIVFLSINAHHVMLSAFVKSYETMPAPTMANLAGIQGSFIHLLTQLSLVALQIAAPVAAVSIVVDAAMGVIGKAVPQMQIFVVGLPAKIVMGMLAISVALPALASGVQYGVEEATHSLVTVFQPHGG